MQTTGTARLKPFTQCVVIDNVAVCGTQMRVQMLNGTASCKWLSQCHAYYSFLDSCIFVFGFTYSLKSAS